MNSESIDDEDKNIDPLVELDKFAAIYSCYPETIFYIYQVYLDMCRRQQYSDVKLFDGQKQWGYSQYILEGNVLNSEKIRYVIPISVDADIDLKKLHDLVTECRATGVEVFMAIYSSENIIYQSVTDDLP